MRKPERRGASLQPKAIVEEIAHLRDLDLAGLRTRWQNEFRRPAPEHLTRYLLFRILAYKIQADRFGDLDPNTIKVLEHASGGDGRASIISKDLLFDDTGHRMIATHATKAGVRYRYYVSHEARRAGIQLGGPRDRPA